MGNHTIKEDKKSRWAEPWLIRRIAYTAIALILLVAVGFGVITPEQSDAWLGNADKALGILASLGLLGAAVKANPGSDVPLTEIEQARADVAAAKLTPSMVDDLIAQAKLAAITVKEARTPHPDSAAAGTLQAGQPEYKQPTASSLPVYTGPTTAGE